MQLMYCTEGELWSPPTAATQKGHKCAHLTLTSGPKEVWANFYPPNGKDLSG